MFFEHILKCNKRISLPPPPFCSLRKGFSILEEQDLTWFCCFHFVVVVIFMHVWSIFRQKWHCIHGVFSFMHILESQESFFYWFVCTKLLRQKHTKKAICFSNRNFPRIQFPKNSGMFPLSSAFINHKMVDVCLRNSSMWW